LIPDEKVTTFKRNEKSATPQDSAAAPTCREGDERERERERERGRERERERERVSERDRERER
jgi:hypothetical protein